jgi:hypothetical protein
MFFELLCGKIGRERIAAKWARAGEPLRCARRIRGKQTPTFVTLRVRDSLFPTARTHPGSHGLDTNLLNHTHKVGGAFHAAGSSLTRNFQDACYIKPLRLVRLR